MFDVDGSGRLTIVPGIMMVKAVKIGGAGPLTRSTAFDIESGWLASRGIEAVIDMVVMGTHCTGRWGCIGRRGRAGAGREWVKAFWVRSAPSFASASDVTLIFGGLNDVGRLRLVRGQLLRDDAELAV